MPQINPVAVFPEKGEKGRSFLFIRAMLPIFHNRYHKGEKQAEKEHPSLVKKTILPVNHKKQNKNNQAENTGA